MKINQESLEGYARGASVEFDTISAVIEQIGSASFGTHKLILAINGKAKSLEFNIYEEYIDNVLDKLFLEFKHYKYNMTWLDENSR